MNFTRCYGREDRRKRASRRPGSGYERCSPRGGRQATPAAYVEQLHTQPTTRQRSTETTDPHLGAGLGVLHVRHRLDTGDTRKLSKVTSLFANNTHTSLALQV